MIYAAFNEGETLVPRPTITTNAQVAMSGINRAGFYNSSTTTNSTYIMPGSLSEGWVHIRVMPNTLSYSSGINPLYCSNASEHCFSLEQRYSGIFRLNVNAGGGTLYNIGITNLVGSNIDINFKIASPGFVKLYLNGALVINHIGNIIMTGDAIIDRLVFGKCVTNGQGNCLLSNIIVSDEPTIGAKVYTLGLTSTIDTEWTGTVSNVTGTGYTDLQNAIRATNAGKKLQLSHTLPELAVDERIAATVLAAEFIAETDQVGNQLDPLFKYAGDFTESDTPQSVTNTEYAKRLWYFQTHPDTGEPWTRQTFNDTTVGLITEYAP